MAYNGSLISIGADNFPLKYVFKESYKVAPNRRQDIDSTRNANGILVRNVLDHTASTISFSTKPMWNDELAELMSFLRNHYSVEKEKKLIITYYCPDLDDYKTGEFYIPDIEFPIYRVESKRIFYSSFTLEFIEY